MVERGAAHDSLFPQYDRPVDRGHRQPDADGDSIRRQPPTGARQPAIPNCAAKMAFPPIDRIRANANRAVIDVASKNGEDFLFNIYRMGKNSIERGSRDNWTVYPGRVAEVQAAIDRDRRQSSEGRPQTEEAPPDAPSFGRMRGGVPMKYYEMLRKPELRDPRGFIIPSDQPDFLTATKFVNALIKTGVTVHRATSDFQAAGKSYPAGSFVVKAAQAFRP